MDFVLGVHLKYEISYLIMTLILTYPSSIPVTIYFVKQLTQSVDATHRNVKIGSFFTSVRLDNEV